MTNLELNEAVAGKLGWVQCCNPGTMENGKIVDCFGWSKGGSHFHEAYPAYSTSIEAAWELVPKFPYFTICQIGDEVWRVTWLPSTAHTPVPMVEADTAPRAICKAFLKLEK